MKNPIVFTDFHHASLLNSLIMLFEGRMGGTVYRPIGIDWATNGFWKIYDHPATQEQYLGIGGATPDGSPKLNQVEGKAWLPHEYPADPYVYFCYDIEGGNKGKIFTNNAITFDGFLKIPIDIVIASIPQHLEPFKRLCEMHPSKPKLIYQIGNAWDIPLNGVENVMASANCLPPVQVNFVKYHQEFDLQVFNPVHSAPYMMALGLYTSSYCFDNDTKNIYSFINCFNTQDHLSEDWKLFQEVESLMTDYNFKSFGGQCRDGNCNGSKELADRMREAQFVWHTKNGGDGYGHVIHNAAACGKPLIVKKQYYYGKMADDLLIDGVTCIAIDGLSAQEIVEKITYYSDPERSKKMAEATYENFKKVVDFDKEEEKLKSFIDNLI